MILIDFGPLFPFTLPWSVYSQHPPQAGWLDSFPEEEAEQICKAWQDPMGEFQAQVMNIRFNGNIAASTVPKKINP